MKVTPEVRQHAQRFDKMFENFRVRDSDSCHSIELQHTVMPDAIIYINLNDPKKFTFSGRFPSYDGRTYQPEQVERPSVSRDRPDIAIAKDISARLISWYLDELSVQRVRIQNDKLRDERRVASMKDIVAYMNGRLPTDLKTSILSSPYTSVHRLQVNSDGTEYSITTHDLPVAAVKRILDIIKEVEQQKKN